VNALRKNPSPERRTATAIRSMLQVSIPIRLITC
jgi:hypothetical protein